ncbi:MAG TPA: DnaB-like helicase N-terminal domain-containing protein, partial [Candidatus Limnocylindria bacterium]|nr:DnaB-like helicase N-terminal domain-containing protein [Candidatus Limnocylindria bacterium]
MDLSAEHAVLGAVLQPDADDSLAQLVDRLEPDDFFTEAHRTIFARMLALRRAGQPVDAVTLEA